MPVFTTRPMAAWCEVEDFEILNLTNGEERAFDAAAPRQLFICTLGKLRLRHQASDVILEMGRQYEARDGKAVRVNASGACQLFRAVGHWEEICGAGIFTTAQHGTPPTGDSPCAYAKHTSFDRHYHDCDEYWIFLEGRAVAVCGDEFHEVGPGDCLATPMGWNHDIAQCHTAAGIRAIYLEGAPRGQRRMGHLWEPKHGPAIPTTI
jgi:mannose-6-phosphate isomerase-like protein (cupin superfamily)